MEWDFWYLLVLNLMVFRCNLSLLVQLWIFLFHFAVNQIEKFVFLYALRANFKNRASLLTSRVSIPKYDSESECEVYWSPQIIKFHSDQNLSKSWSVSKLHQWFKSYGYLTEGVDFAYRWSFMVEGLRSTGLRRLVFYDF